MIDYVINVLYEKYEWVEWDLCPVEFADFSNSWGRIDRSLPC